MFVIVARAKIRPYRHRQAARRWATTEARRRWVVSGDVSKRVAVYGTTVSRRGIRRNRIEIYGKGQDLMQAVILMHTGYVPKRPHRVISAEDLNDDPFEHVERARAWIKESKK